ncbi:hypothetical protein N9053_00760 [bacterium]|nr:hypothetical protein [bacterium]
MDQADYFPADRSGTGHFVGHGSSPFRFAATGKTQVAITETQSKSELIIMLQVDGK